MAPGVWWDVVYCPQCGTFESVDTYPKVKVLREISIIDEKLNDKTISEHNKSRLNAKRYMLQMTYDHKKGPDDPWLCPRCGKSRTVLKIDYKSLYDKAPAEQIIDIRCPFCGKMRIKVMRTGLNWD